MASYAHPESTSLGSTLAPAPLIRAHMHIMSISFRRQFPVEIQERIIDQLRLRDDVRSLRACSLTCHAWHVRSRFHLLRDIRIHCPEQFKDICSYFHTHESLRPLVQSLVIDTIRQSPPDPTSAKSSTLPASDFVSTQLFSQLPNLHRCELRDSILDRSYVHSATFHSSILIYLMTHSSIETLCLSHVRFSSPTSFVGLISALQMLRRLVCNGIDIGRTTEGSAQIVKFGLTSLGYKKHGTKLRSLEIRGMPPSEYSQLILLIPGGRVEKLVMDVWPSSAPNKPSSRSLENTRAALACVKSLELHVYHDLDTFAVFPSYAAHWRQWVLMVLDNGVSFMQAGILQDITFVFHGSPYHLQHLLQDPVNTTLLTSLQQTILSLSPRTVAFTSATTPVGWMSIQSSIRQAFPVLFKQELAKIVPPRPAGRVSVHRGGEETL
ncbi:hypothetical protein L227DRAFT_382075 [Lentinus tigrinus ALCF2SS1-6]|uniref:F-box domain-containing protein n=1 Tax=Lentinus tigrinus ALCF2SS1-6 TaxID=1328759 RepID=A0A5C2RQ00_9APHY|nr:hypothetical protein L227DRAFT_382075 [Lentinus tigrinus ALCF2SS1-6]